MCSNKRRHPPSTSMKESFEMVLLLVVWLPNFRSVNEFMYFYIFTFLLWYWEDMSGVSTIILRELLYKHIEKWRKRLSTWRYVTLLHHWRTPRAHKSTAPCKSQDSLRAGLLLVTFKVGLSLQFVQCIREFKHIKHVSQFEVCPDWRVEEFWTLKWNKKVSSWKFYDVK